MTVYRATYRVTGQKVTILSHHMSPERDGEGYCHVIAVAVVTGGTKAGEHIVDDVENFDFVDFGGR